MHKPIKKAAFLVISAVNPQSQEREYLFMHTSADSVNPGKIAIFGGEVEEDETIIEGLHRELMEEISTKGAKQLIAALTTTKPRIVHRETLEIDTSQPGREHWHNSSNYIYGVDIPHKELKRLAEQSDETNCDEVGGTEIISQNELTRRIKEGSLNLRYDFELQGLEKEIVIRQNADRFKARVLAVCEVLKKYGIDTEIKLDDSVDLFFRRTGFQSNFLDSAGFYHEAAGHIGGCATTGTITDEGRAAIAEAIFCGDKSYDSLAYNQHDRYADEFDAPIKKIRLTPKFDAFIEHRIKTAADYLEIQKNYLLRVFKDGQSYYPPEEQIKRDRIDRQSQESVLSVEDKQALIERVSRQNEFFLKLTGGRPLEGFLIESLKTLPTAFLGVAQTNEQNPEMEAFAAIPEDVMDAIETQIYTLDMAA